MEGQRRRNGFSLIKILVAIIVIIAITSMLLFIILVPFLQGNDVKRAGKFVHAVFTKGRQLAGYKKRIYYLVFDPTANSISFWEDTDNNKQYSALLDQPLSNEAMVLPAGIGFARGPNGIINRTTCIVGIRPDGSLTQGDAATPNLPLSDFQTASVFDAGVAENPQMATGDIVLQPINPAGGPWPGTERVDTVLIDIDPKMGIIRKVEYVKSKNTTF